MMKKDKLYTVNKWNKPMFSPRKNIFAYGTPTLGASTPTLNISQDSINSWISNNPKSGLTYGLNLFQNYGTSGDALNDQVNSLIKKKNIQGDIKAGQGGPGIAGMIGGAASVVGDIPTGERRGMWDTADPLHHLAGGRESAVGNVMGDAGVALFKTGASSGNPYLMLAGGIAKGVGSLVNAAFGMKEDTALKQAVESGISQNQNFNSNVNSFDDIQGPRAVVTNTNVYKGGWFTGGKARRKNEELRKRMTTAKDLAWRSVYNNVDNISKDQINNALSQYFAYGGNLFGNDGDMGAIEYDFMDRYLTNYKDKNQQKEALTNLFAGTPSSLFADGGGIHIKKANEGKFTEQARKAGMGVQEYASHVLANKDRYPSKWHAFGGDLQTNGADFSTGATHVNAGSSHEMNPYDGVQMGVDAEGTPNLVEEGEVVFDDYVYSNRIPVDAETKKKFHLPKKKDISYADLAKKLEKEIQERPNDPISKAGFKAQMHELADQQERQRQEMEAARAREAFEALSPEEQTAIMQRAAQEEALAQQAAQEQAVAEQQAMQQPSPEEIAMMQQQMQADGSEAMLGQEPQISAYGGKINRFDNGGALNKLLEDISSGKEYTGRLLNGLGFNSAKDFEDWVKKSIPSNSKIFSDTTLNPVDLLHDPEFIKAVGEKNSSLAHSLASGNDFGITIRPDEKGILKIGSNGQWTSTTPIDWWGNNGKNTKRETWDPAFNELVNSYDTEEDAVKALNNMDRKAFEEALSNTEAYKKTTEWLKNKDNALSYLRAVVADESLPEKARKYALDFIKKNEKTGEYDWIDENYDYDKVFGKVRSSYPGTYWKTALPAVRNKETRSYLRDADGNWKEVAPAVGVDSKWTKDSTHSWYNPETGTDITYNYYLDPSVKSTTAAKAAEAAAEEEGEQRGVRPVHRSETLRYAGLFGPAVGLGLQMAGVGRPDTSKLDAAVSSIGNTALADYKPLGNYLTYRPMDIWYEQNRMDANARATDRAILNNSAPVGTRMAGLLASGYNNQIANGELYRKALEYNDAKRAQVAEFNRGTDQFNADAYNRLSQFNANAINQDRHLRANMSMQAARDKMDADAGWYNSIYGNIGGLFKGLSDLGRENAQRNMIADMAAAGIFGNMNPDNFNPNGVLRWETDEEMKKNSTKKSAHGGSIKRKKGKRGLTY